MNLFIDTNIYLSFYHFASDDLEELKKLLVAISSGKIKLFTNVQLQDEFKRNREFKIADALKIFTDKQLDKSFPQFCKEYQEYKELRRAIQDFADTKGKLLDKLKNDIQNRNLGADKLIEELFSESRVEEIPDKILEQAKNRVNVGNPPGKNGSVGDAINWEMLLSAVPDGEELIFISSDSDFFSPLDDNRFLDYLSEEWMEKKNSKVIFYKSLNDFFSKHFPNIKLAAEFEKTLAIERLASSPNFATTHARIARLSTYADFTDTEARSIVEAILTNDQVYSIATDPDIKTFIQRILDKYASKIEENDSTKLQSIIQEDEDDPLEPPF